MTLKFPSDGRLDEYPVFRILAEIGTHRLSGVLTVSAPQDTADFFFDSGSCVFAESHYPRSEFRLGQLLILRGFCDQKQLDELLTAQTTKMIKLGRMAKDAGWLSDTELMRVLEDQILLILFPSLTWDHGIYFFKQIDSVPYDRSLFRPVDLKPIFRNGQKILKSWSWMKDRLSNDQMIPRKVQGVEVIPEGVKLDHPSDADNIRVLTRIQEKIYELVDGSRSIREICDTVHMFEWFSRIAILDLQDAGILTIEENLQKRKKKIHSESKSRTVTWRGLLETHAPMAARIFAGILGVIAIGFLISQISFKNFSKVEQEQKQVFTPKSSTITLIISDEIRSALVVVYFNEESFPDSISQLVDQGLIEVAMLTDGWGTDFHYRKMEDRYELTSAGPDGEFSTSDDLLFPGQISDHIFGCFYPRPPVSNAGDIQQGLGDIR